MEISNRMVRKGIQPPKRLTGETNDSLENTKKSMVNDNVHGNKIKLRFFSTTDS